MIFFYFREFTAHVVQWYKMTSRPTNVKSVDPKKGHISYVYSFCVNTFNVSMSTGHFVSLFRTCGELMSQFCVPLKNGILVVHLDLVKTRVYHCHVIIYCGTLFGSVGKAQNLICKSMLVRWSASWITHTSTMCTKGRHENLGMTHV